MLCLEPLWAAVIASREALGHQSFDNATPSEDWAGFAIKRVSISKSRTPSSGDPAGRPKGISEHECETDKIRGRSKRPARRGYPPDQRPGQLRLGCGRSGRTEGGFSAQPLWTREVPHRRHRSGARGPGRSSSLRSRRFRQSRRNALPCSGPQRRRVEDAAQTLPDNGGGRDAPHRRHPLRWWSPTRFYKPATRPN